MEKPAMQGKGQGATTALRQTAKRPIDMLHLARQSLGDASLQLEILRMYDEIIAVHFDRLKQARTIPDMLHHLHTLKAASTGVGAWGLAEHAHIMEQELKHGAAVDAEQIDDIHMSLLDVREFIAGQVGLDEAANG